jgi:hypothetical protein
MKQFLGPGQSNLDVILRTHSPNVLCKLAHCGRLMRRDSSILISSQAE